MGLIGFNPNKKTSYHPLILQILILADDGIKGFNPNKKKSYHPLILRILILILTKDLRTSRILEIFVTHSLTVLLNPARVVAFIPIHG